MDIWGNVPDTLLLLLFTVTKDEGELTSFHSLFLWDEHPLVYHAFTLLINNMRGKSHFAQSFHALSIFIVMYHSRYLKDWLLVCRPWCEWLPMIISLHGTIRIKWSYKLCQQHTFLCQMQKRANPILHPFLRCTCSFSQASQERALWLFGLLSHSSIPFYWICRGFAWGTL